MILAVLGIVDVIAGIMLSLGWLPYMQGNALVFVVAVIVMIKGAWSWIAALAASQKLDFLGILDLVVGIMLLSTSGGFFLFFFTYVGIIDIIKGIYSAFVGVAKQ
jgi:uncharacterized membrane protein HdeD (DUF308 family)